MTGILFDNQNQRCKLTRSEAARHTTISYQISANNTILLHCVRSIPICGLRNPPLDAAIPYLIMAPNLTLFSINAVLILSTDDSSRILARYYNAPHPPHGTPANSTNYPGANPYPNLKDQKAFEKGLLEKTVKQSTDVILYDKPSGGLQARERCHAGW